MAYNGPIVSVSTTPSIILDITPFSANILNTNNNDNYICDTCASTNMGQLRRNSNMRERKRERERKCG